MIVIGVDVHKQSVTAVAVDEAGRILDERTVLVGSDELIGWASALDTERLWALEANQLPSMWRSPPHPPHQGVSPRRMRVRGHHEFDDRLRYVASQGVTLTRLPAIRLNASTSLTP